VRKQRSKKEHEKNKKKDPCDARRRYGDTRKSEDRSNNRNDKENSSPIEHVNLLCNGYQKRLDPFTHFLISLSITTHLFFDFFNRLQVVNE
jgi:hypothetical protein